MGEPIFWFYIITIWNQFSLPLFIGVSYENEFLQTIFGRFLNNPAHAEKDAH